MDFDNFLKKGGEFGRYQIYLFFIMVPFIAFIVVALFGQIFIAATPDHWCHVPVLDAANLSTEETKHLYIPQEKILGGKKYSHCTMYNGTFEQIQAGLGPKGELPVIPCQYGWDYDLTDIPYHTIVSELDWVCDRNNYATIAQSLFFVGAIVGGIIFGIAADIIGRVPVLIASNVIGGVAGSLTAAVTNFWQFALCRFCMAMEYIGARYRTLVANLAFAIFFTLFSILIPWIAYWIRDWRAFALYTSLPMLLAISSFWLVPESARWLVSQGKIDRAMKIMRTYFKVNKAKISEEEIADFEKDAIRMQAEADEDVTYTMIDLVKTPRLRRITIILMILWMIICFCFDGHIRNVGNLGYDMFVTSSLTCATEFPADVVMMMLLDRVGRRWMASVTLILSGLFSASTSLVPNGNKAVYFALAILGRFHINITYNIGLQYAAELLPTVVRGQGIGLIHIMGYVANIVSPIIVYLAIYGQFVPLLILGLFAVAGGIISLFLPETLNMELPESLEEGEQFGKDQKFWNFPCLNKSKETDNEAKEEPTESRKGSIELKGYNAQRRRSSGFAHPNTKARLRRASTVMSIRVSGRSPELSGQNQAREEMAAEQQQTP